MIKPIFSLDRFYLGEFCAATGWKEKALENLKKAEGLFREMVMNYWPGRIKEILGTLL
jgi:hypothetical protein